MPQSKKIHLIDTNIILRYLIGDDKEKAIRAATLMEHVEKGTEQIEISPVVVAETIWTLEKFYKVPKKEISAKLLSLFLFKGVRGG